MIERIEFLTAYERSLMTTDAAGLTSDTDIGISITYRQFVSRTMTPSTGLSTVTYTDSTLRVIKNMLTAGEIRAADGLYQMGDLRLILARSLLAITPNKEDQIVIEGETYSLVNWDTDPANLLWRIVARKMS